VREGSEISPRALAAHDDDLVDLFENAPCGYLSLEPSGRITKVNATFCSWIGLDHEKLVGRRFQDLLNIAGKIYFETHFAPLLRMQGFFHEVALEMTPGDGKSIPVLVNAVQRKDENGTLRFIRMTVFNASDRRRYERELLAARKQADAAASELRILNETLNKRVAAEVEERMRAEQALRQAQKMEAIGQLTGGVAHDFNNLLTVILGSLERISTGVRELTPSRTIERLTRSTDMAAQAAERAAKLTARLLAFSRQQALEPKPLDLPKLVTGLADLLQRTLGEKVRLETVSGAGVWRTFADPSELENTIINLAVNARDAMPEGGQLTIEVSNAHLDDSYVATITEPVAPGQYVLLAVSDTGSGMAPETVSRVFEPFFTTKEVGKGTGLGLSQVYGFVRQTGGHVRIYSELGEGTTVKLYLPRYHGAEAWEESSAADYAHLSGGDETILLVEDDEQLREFSSSVLRDQGYHVIVAENGPKALRQLRGRTHVDLLFTDVVLPGGMDGRRLAEAALAQMPDLKVLYTTGYTRNAIVHNGRLDPGVQMIGKPFSSAALCVKVRRILDS
jgi:PAS domain S-box-containing protein